MTPWPQVPIRAGLPYFQCMGLHPLHMSPEPSAPSENKRAARTAPKRPFSRLEKVICAALFLLLALTAVQCVRLGLAGLLVQLAKDETDRWTSASRSPDRSKLRRAGKYFTDSLEYTADNPWSLEGLGALYLTRMRASTNPREALALARDARVRLLQALRLRPTSPFLWANLALTKLYLDEFDDEMRSALRHADELGPWEPTVQQTILFVGLAAWQDLDSSLRQSLARTLERGASRNPRRMFEIVKSYTRFDLVCAIEGYRLIAGSDCRKPAETAAPVLPGEKGIRP